MIEVKVPKSEKDWDAYYDLRYRVLREPLGKERGSERNEGDATGKHFALLENQTILAVFGQEYNKRAFATAAADLLPLPYPPIRK